jgi:hypothetical protein
MRNLLTNGTLWLICFLLFGRTAYGQSGRIQRDSGIGAAWQTSGGQVPLPDSLCAPSDRPVYSGDLRRVPESQVKTLQQDPVFAYANDPAYWKEASAAGPDIAQRLIRFLYSRAFRAGLLIVFLLLTGYGIYRLAKENAFSWFRRSGRISPDAPVETEEAMTDIDLDEAIRENRGAGNYQQAVRYMYLKAIRTLIAGNLIPVNPFSTNAEMTSAFRDPEQARAFRYLATAYEYIFYGAFQPGPEQFDRLQQKFEEFYQSILQ